LGDLSDELHEIDETNVMPGTYTRESGGSVWTKQ